MAEQQNKGEQTLSPVQQKSAEDVQKSSARAKAESTTQKSSGAQKTDDNRTHPMQGRSLPYVTGAGAESYTEGQYASDKVNEEDHFKR